jgi:anti-anti-sigma factor
MSPLGQLGPPRGDLSDGRVVVEIRGEVDVVHAERVRQVLLQASADRPTVLVVDLLYVTFIDSTGIGALAAGYNAARRLGVRRPSPFIETQLRQTGLYDVRTADRGPQPEATTVASNNASAQPDTPSMDHSPEDLAPALAAIDAGEVNSILTPSADFAELAHRRGYWVIEVNAGTETLYEVRAAGRGINGVRVEAAG